MPKSFAMRLALPVLLAAAAPAVAQDDFTPDTVIATVNGNDITLGHMLVIRARLPEQYNTLPDNVLFDGILDQLVRQELASQEATELTGINAFILENERRALLASQMTAGVAREAVTEENLRATYDSLYSDFAETEYNASHILVETQEEAHAIVEDLGGGADFATLARERSTGPSGPNGGSLGWFGEGMMVPAFEEAVLALSVGEVSEPVETQFGWHVVVLNDKRTQSAPPFEELRGELVTTVQEEAYEDYIAGLRQDADIVMPKPDDVPTAIINQLDLLQ